MRSVRRGCLSMCDLMVTWLGQASLVTQMIKNLPARQETWEGSLGREDPLEKEMAAHSSILAWRIPWTEGLGGIQSMGSQRGGHDWATSTFTFWIGQFSRIEVSMGCSECDQRYKKGNKVRIKNQRTKGWGWEGDLRTDIWMTVAPRKGPDRLLQINWLCPPDG